MTTLISPLTVAALAVLLATAAVGLGAILVRVGSSSTVPADGPIGAAAIRGRRAPAADRRRWPGARLRAAGRRDRGASRSDRPRAMVQPPRVQPRLRRRNPRHPPAPGTVASDERPRAVHGPLAAGLVAFGLGLDDRIDPLVPALQQPLLLTVHVGTAVLAYAVAAVAFVAAAAEIGQARADDRIPFLPSASAARAIGHRAVLVAFPILTVAIVLGSVWANLARRSYWSNDPKELAAAATWLVFGAYLHVAGRRDRWGGLPRGSSSSVSSGSCSRTSVPACSSWASTATPRREPSGTARPDCADAAGCLCLRGVPDGPVDHDLGPGAAMPPDIEDAEGRRDPTVERSSGPRRCRSSTAWRMGSASGTAGSSRRWTSTAASGTQSVA